MKIYTQNFPCNYLKNFLYDWKERARVYLFHPVDDFVQIRNKYITDEKSILKELFESD